MQMIDVLKRLAELDAKNPNVVKEGQLGTMGLDAFPDELARMRATREKMDNDTEWLLKNKPTDPCSKCGEPTTYRSSFGTTQKLICAKCGEVRLSSDDRKEHQDMAESDNDLVGMVQSTIEDILSGAQQGQDMTDNIADELGDHFDAVQNSGDENLQQAYSMVRDAADTSPEEQAQAAQSALEMLSGGQGVAESLQECGMMGSMSQPHSPASINITADSGAELTGMLKDIMSLAGLKQVTPHDLGHEHEPAVISAEPGISIAKVDDEPTIMRSMLDKLNPEMDDEEKIAEWDNEPTNVDDIPPMSQDAMLNKAMHNQDPAGAPGAGDGRHLKNNPIATPEETYESLMADYKKFISEN